MIPTRIIVGGNYEQGCVHVGRTPVQNDRPFVVGLHHTIALRGWNGLSYIRVEFVGAWRERPDLDEVLLALCASGVDGDWLWCALTEAGLSEEEADAYVGYSVTGSVRRSLSEIVASLEPP